MNAAIIQARMGSTRLPGKTLTPLADHTLLWHVVNRLRPAKTLQAICVATTTDSADDAVVEWCKKNDIQVFRGSESNVLDRYFQCAKSLKADVVVRITADDPFKDYRQVDAVVEKLISEKLDFACNNKPPTLPEGLDVEAFTFAALSNAHANAKDLFEQEHVTQYFHRHQEEFKIGYLTYEPDRSELRWTIDNQEDLDMAKEVYRNLFATKKVFLTEDILKLINEHPHIAEINNTVKRSFMYQKKDSK